jgi:hypothetical protein
MRVSELKSGMLLRPKDGFIFKLHNEWSGGPEHLECCSVKSLSYDQRRNRSHRLTRFSEKLVIYICKQPKSNEDSAYEYRHEIYVPFFGRSMRMASEYWRNIEEVK